MNRHLARHPDRTVLRCVAGLLICDAQLKNADAVIAGISQRRNQMHSGEVPGPAVFHHKVVLTQK
jgi:hypothetical protein